MMRLSYSIVILLIVFSVTLSIAYYPELPDRMVSHWNGNFEPDGTIDKLVGLSICPIILILLGAMFLAFPRIDPLKKNIETFRGDFEYFVVLILAFMLFLHLMVIWWNLGYELDFGLFFPLWMAAIFFAAGTLCKRARRNWFIGVRTPWAMNSDRVWKETNRRGGIIFQVSGLLLILGVFSSLLFFILLIASIIVLGVYTTTYSYRAYQKELKEKKSRPRYRRLHDED